VEDKEARVLTGNQAVHPVAELRLGEKTKKSKGLIN